MTTDLEYFIKRPHRNYTWVCNVGVYILGLNMNVVHYNSVVGWLT